ncbi:MAG: hypothetical protein PHC53_02500 [Patescibacteria group bacterium]|nr:hypothetical protein [Patescibacteria group bacterium]
MQKKSPRLSKTQRRCVRQILSRVRQMMGASPSRVHREKLRTTIVQQLTGEIRRETIVAGYKPKATPRVSSPPTFCKVCNRNTRHRRGECQEHDVKYCDVCKKMTARTANDKCAEHTVSDHFCIYCGIGRTFINGACPLGHIRPR